LISNYILHEIGVFGKRLLPLPLQFPRIPNKAHYGMLGSRRRAGGWGDGSVNPEKSCRGRGAGLYAAHLVHLKSLLASGFRRSAGGGLWK